MIQLLWDLFFYLTSILVAHWYGRHVEKLAHIARLRKFLAENDVPASAAANLIGDEQ